MLILFILQELGLTQNVPTFFLYSVPRFCSSVSHPYSFTLWPPHRHALLLDSPSVSPLPLVTDPPHGPSTHNSCHPRGQTLPQCPAMQHPPKPPAAPPPPAHLSGLLTVTQGSMVSRHKAEVRLDQVGGGGRI